MMYRRFISQADYDEIVQTYKDSDTPPHCNQNVFHDPGLCAYCDSYYKAHPSFQPPEYEFADANGWGGNMAPIVDDKLAAEEQAAWDQEMKSLALTVPPSPIPNRTAKSTAGRRFMNWITRQ